MTIVLQKNNYDNKLAEILSLIENVPFENGHCHPAEIILENFILNDDNSSTFLCDLFFESNISDYEKSVLIILLSRKKYFTMQWRIKIIEQCLKSSNIELRDRTICACETLAESTNEASDENKLEKTLITNILVDHYEPVKYLREYIDKIISDFKK